MTDRELVLKVLSGDGAALAALLSRHERDLRRIPGAMLRDVPNTQVLLEDVYQTFLVHLLENGARRLGMWQGLTDVADTEASIASYLGEILRNLTNDLLRKLDTPEEGEETDEGIEGGPSTGESPEEGLDREERERMLRECVSALPAGMRDAMQLRLEGWSDAEGATRLQIKGNTFRQRVHAGIRALTECVQAGGAALWRPHGR